MQANKQQEEQNTAMKSLQELCAYPVLYVNIRAVQSENRFEANKDFAVTISNKEPEINETTFEAKYPVDAFAVDLFFNHDINSFITDLSLHWAKMVCSILTFRGHEVFFNNKLFVPFENNA